MSKKSFANNPALRFISEPETEQEERTEAQPEAITAAAANRAAVMDKLEEPKEAELKSRRVQVILRPSLYKKAKATAKAKGLSFNELVHQALEIVTKEK